MCFLRVTAFFLTFVLKPVIKNNSVLIWLCAGAARFYLKWAWGSYKSGRGHQQNLCRTLRVVGTNPLSKFIDLPLCTQRKKIELNDLRQFTPNNNLSVSESEVVDYGQRKPVFLHSTAYAFNIILFLQTHTMIDKAHPYIHSTVVLGIAMVYPHWKPYIRILFIFTFNLNLISLLMISRWRMCEK